MNNIKKILVPVDFSATSEAALRYVTGLITKSEDTQVTLLHVCSSVLSQEERAKLQQKLSAMVEQWADQIPASSQQIETGNLVETIVKVQQLTGSDLIVMGTQGSQDQDLETRTSQLVLEADCPVLVIPDQVKEFSLKNIALALGENIIDNSGGLQALHDLARTFDATVHVLTINRNGESPSIKAENQEVLEYYLESLLYFHAFPQNSDIEIGISDYLEANDIDMLAILPRNHAKTTKPSEGRLTKLLTMHTTVPLLTID